MSNRFFPGRAIHAPFALLLAFLALPDARSQDPQELPAAASQWDRCTAIADGMERLACFDDWARQQQTPALQADAAMTKAPDSAAQDDQAHTQEDDAPPVITPQDRIGIVLARGGCHDTGYSEVSRFWELEKGSSCGTFGIRGYRPILLSWAKGNRANRQPQSPSPDNTLDESLDYDSAEMRIQISLRTKLAQGMLTPPDSPLRDSLWFGYTVQSYWQVFNSGLSRPFRSTDHEPELVYVYPTTARLPWGWQWRYTGLGLVHQSNGQSLPKSRSWNRVYLMSAMEHPDGYFLGGRIWKRIHENASKDDNPDISDYIGRMELSAGWRVSDRHTLSATIRHALTSQSRGSARLDWYYKLGDAKTSQLHLYTSLFSGYGDSLIDYNFRRTVFSLGLSLLDF